MLELQVQTLHYYIFHDFGIGKYLKIIFLLSILRYVDEFTIECSQLIKVCSLTFLFQAYYFYFFIKYGI